MSFLKLIIAVIFLLGVTYFGLLISAYQDPIQIFQHSYFTPFGSRRAVVVPFSARESVSMFAASGRERMIYWANLWIDKEDSISLVQCRDSSLEKTCDPDGSYGLSTVKPEDFLTLNKVKNRLVLNVPQNKENIHQKVAKALESLEDRKVRVLVQSSVNNVLISLKEMEPFLLYGTSFKDLTLWGTLSALRLLPLASWKGDVWVSALQKNRMTLMTPEIASEVARRQRSIIIGPVTNQSELDLALSYHPAAIFCEPQLGVAGAPDEFFLDCIRQVLEL